MLETGAADEPGNPDDPNATATTVIKFILPLTDLCATVPSAAYFRIFGSPIPKRDDHHAFTIQLPPTIDETTFTSRTPTEAIVPPAEADTGMLVDTVLDSIPDDLSFTTLGAADQLRSDALLADQAQQAAAAVESGNPDETAADNGDHMVDLNSTGTRDSEDEEINAFHLGSPGDSDGSDE